MADDFPLIIEGNGTTANTVVSNSFTKNKNVTRVKHFKMVRGDTLTFGVIMKLVSDNDLDSAYFSISSESNGKAIITKSLNNGVRIDKLQTINVYQTAFSSIPPFSAETFSVMKYIDDETPPQETIAPRYKYGYLYKIKHDYYDYRVEPPVFLCPAGTLFLWDGYRYIYASDFFGKKTYISLEDYQNGNVFGLAIRVAPSETEQFLPGVYYYDLQIGIAKSIKTVLRGTLTIDLEVSKMG